MPRAGGWSRRIGKCLDGGQVTEALETGSIVVVYEAVEEGIAIGVRDEEAMGAASLGLLADGVDDATVEAFDQSIGLRPVRSREAMIDVVLGTEAIEGMPPGRLIVGLALHVDSETVGELAAVVGQNGVNAMRELGDEAAKKAGGGFGIAPGMDFEIDETCGSIDGDEGVTLSSLQGWQVFEIDMDEADGGLLEGADRRFFGLRPLVQPETSKTAMDCAPGETGVDAPPHHLGDVVERQVQFRPQFANQRLVERREASRQRPWRVRAVGNGRTPPPTPDRGLTHAELASQSCYRRSAALNVGPYLWCGRSVGVQGYVHDTRRSLT